MFYQSFDIFSRRNGQGEYKKQGGMKTAINKCYFWQNSKLKGKKLELENSLFITHMWSKH